MADDTGRPDPLGDAVASQTPPAAAVATILTALLGAGVLTTGGVSVLNLVLVIAAAAVSGAAALIGARRVAAAARPGVTPTLDPRTDTGDELVPRTSALLVDVLEQVATILAPATDTPQPATPAPVASLATGAPPPPVRAAGLLAAPPLLPSPGTYPDYSPDRLWADVEQNAAARRGRHRPPGGG